MQLKTTFTVKRNDDGPYFGAYLAGSLTQGNPIILLNIESIVQVLQDENDKAVIFKDAILQGIVHEFAHSMQEWLDLEMDELQVEQILGAYNEKWNVFEAEGGEEINDETHFKVGELLDFLNTINAPDDQNEDFSNGVQLVKDKLAELFKPFILWREAAEKHGKIKNVD